MKRRFDYDLLRVLSMLGVIYLHTAAGSLRALEYTALWNFSNLLVALATPAVPLFFMMSGALLLGSSSTEEVKALFTHRIPKVFVPLVAWSLLLLLYELVTVSFGDALGSLIAILNTPVSTPYWFLYALIPMYLLSPMLKKMTDGLTAQHWNYMMLLWVVLTLGLHTLRSFLPETWQLIFSEHWTLNINAVGGYLGYFLLGAYLERLERIPSKKVLAGVIVLMAAVITVGTRWDTYAHGAYSARFTDYLSLFTMVLSASIFLLAKSCLRNKSPGGKLIPLLSGISFGVYLLHPIALGIGQWAWSTLTGLNDLVTVPHQLVFYLCVVVFCVAVTVILTSVKPLCFLFTGQKFSAACKSCNLFFLFSGESQKEGE